MSRGQLVGLALLGLSLAACGDPGAERVPGDPAAERARAADAFEEYDLEALAWFREGRPIEFAGGGMDPRRSAGFAAPRNSFERVGEFEGMGLYAIITTRLPMTRSSSRSRAGCGRPSSRSPVISRTSP